MQIIHCTEKRLNPDVSARVAMAFIQLAEDEWLKFCNDENAAKMGYEKNIVKENTRSIRQKMRNKSRQLGREDIYNGMLEDMANLADIAEPHLMELRGGIRKNIIGKCPVQWIDTFVTVTTTYTMLEVVRQVIRLTYNSYNRTINETLEVIDNIDNRHHIGFTGSVKIDDGQLYRIINKIMEEVMRGKIEY